VTASNYDQTFDMTLASSYNAAFVTQNGATVDSPLQALVAGLDAEKAYLNIHTTFRSGGEIRGFLKPVPEPQTWALVAAGPGGLVVLSRRRRSPSLPSS